MTAVAILLGQVPERSASKMREQGARVKGGGGRGGVGPALWGRKQRGGERALNPVKTLPTSHSASRWTAAPISWPPPSPCCSLLLLNQALFQVTSLQPSTLNYFWGAE